jgi:hypothetical protein
MYKCRQKQDAGSGHGCIHGVFWKRYLILADKSGNKFQTVT